MELFEAAEPGRLRTPVAAAAAVAATRPWELLGRELAREGTGLGEQKYPVARTGHLATLPQGPATMRNHGDSTDLYYSTPPKNLSLCSTISNK